MLKLTSKSDLEEHVVELSPAVYDCLDKFLFELAKVTEGSYNPETDGYMTAITSNTKEGDALWLFGKCWKNINWEGVLYDYKHKCFVGIYLFNNQFAVSVVVENAHWVEKLLPGFLDSLMTLYDRSLDEIRRNSAGVVGSESVWKDSEPT